MLFSPPDKERQGRKLLALQNNQNKESFVFVCEYTEQFIFENNKFQNCVLGPGYKF